MPPIIAISVSSTENARPLRMKLWMSFQLKNPKSRCMSDACSLRAEQAWHLDAAFDEGGEPVHRECRDEVQAGDGEVDLDAARGLFLRLHREHRQLGDRHRERDRGVLDDVHRLAGER